MRILGVAEREFLFVCLVSLLLAGALFYPAIVNFGEVMYGEEDIQFFIWVFEHFGKSLENGTNPFFAEEIYYPYGVSLAMSTTSPLQAVIYLLLPESWGAFGKITFLQMASFVLGGIFSFCLVYRFAKSFLPALLGSVIYNFSAFHFEKMLHHLNYSMGLAFLPLFFYFYYQALDKLDRKNLALLSASLLLLGLCEMTLSIMAGFIVMLDIFIRYMEYSKKKIFTPKNTLVLGISLVCSLVCFEILSLNNLPNSLVYSLPSLVFILPFAFVIIGLKNLEECEKAHRYFQIMVAAAIPLLLWLGFLALQPTYGFSESVIANTIINYNQLEYLLFPSNLQAISALLPWEALPIDYSMGIYLGPVILALLLASYLLNGATGLEIKFRNWSILLILFSFPILVIGNQIVAITPFIVETLFPLLPVLRVPARFIVFALLFLSIFAALLVQRILQKHKQRDLLIGGLIALFLLLSWPALDQFEFEEAPPGFYLELAGIDSNQSIFIYPTAEYELLSREMYFQTMHKKPISCGALSRFPNTNDEDANELFHSCYESSFYGIDGYTDEGYAKSIGLVEKHGYDYIVFYLDGGKHDEVICSKLAAEFGEAVYEDGERIVYAN